MSSRSARTWPGSNTSSTSGPLEWDELLSAGQTVSMDRLAAAARSLDFDDPINIQYTSGTTGLPKGATLSHHNILNNGYFVAESLSYGDDDRVCIPVPFYHCFGMVMGNLACTSHGATMVLPDAAFDAAAVLDAVQAERCTSLYGVPTMFIAELAHPSFADHDLSSLRTGVMAGSPCPVEVMKQVISAMGMEEVAICYGMTETSPVSTQTSPHDGLDKRVGTVGQVHPHVEIKITDPVTGRTVPRGEPGRAAHPRLLGDARVLGRPGPQRRSHRPGQVDAHRGSRHHGRRRLRQHRRAHQGHDHSWWGERLSPGGRGVPLRPPRHRGRPGHRRAR